MTCLSTRAAIGGRGFALSIACLVLVGLASPVDADTVLNFGQSIPGQVTATDNGAGMTTMTTPAGGILVTVTTYGNAPASFTAFETFVGVHSTGAATDVGVVQQKFAGTFKFTSGPGGTGVNFLTATFVDVVFGVSGGTQATFNASTPPPGNVVFTSDILNFSASTSRSLSLGLSGLTPPLSVSADNSISSFVTSGNGATAGNFFADHVTFTPEPATLGSAGLAVLASLAYAWRRRCSVKA